MDLHHIRYFLAVASTLNFTKAASIRNVSQPAISRAIQQLEKEVGGPLFQRERKFTRLTDLGKIMKPHFESILAAVDNVRDEARKFTSTEAETLNVGVLCTIGPRHFVDALNRFASYSAVANVNIFEGTLREIVARLESGEIDVALMASPRKLDERFRMDFLYHESFVVAFPIGHRFSKLHSVPLADLHGEGYLKRLNCEFETKIDQLLSQRYINLRTIYSSEREDWILDMVAAGLGVCFIPEFGALLPTIESLPVSEPAISRDIYAVTMTGRKISPAISDFLTSLNSIEFPKTRFFKDAESVDILSVGGKKRVEAKSSMNF